jgi:hypothetical protein
MPPEHRNIQRWIRKNYSAQFGVLAEIFELTADFLKGYERTPRRTAKDKS